MATELQEISVSPEASTAMITSTTPESFLVKSEESEHPSPESQPERDFAGRRKVAEENTIDRSPQSESISNVNDDDEGFRTPTSSDRRIPAANPCPPAPRKPKSMYWSRRSSKASGIRRSFRVYVADDVVAVESIFSARFETELQNQRRKKARKDGNGDELE